MQEDNGSASSLNEEKVVTVDVTTQQVVEEYGSDIDYATRVDPLGKLTDEQLAGFYAFKEWYSVGPKTGVLDGQGGTGKTFSLAAWIIALGIDVTKIKALAPSNSAVKSLKESLWGQGVQCSCLTIDSALGYGPNNPKWEREDRLALADLEKQRDDADAADNVDLIRDVLDPKIRQLYRAQQAVKKNETVFSAGAYAPTEVDAEDCHLVIVDECSMVRGELFDALVTTFNKVFFMGDKEQLFPVKESMSRTFGCPGIAVFSNVMRSKGELRVLNAALRTRDLSTVYSVARGVPLLRGELQVNSAATINRVTARTLMHDWISNRPWDGESFRLICYKNETIENTLVHLKRYVGKDWEKGDLILANKPLARFCITNKRQEKAEQMIAEMALTGEGDWDAELAAELEAIVNDNPDNTEDEIAKSFAQNRSQSRYASGDTALVTNADSEILKVCSEHIVPVYTSSGYRDIKVMRAIVSAPGFKQTMYYLKSFHNYLEGEWADTYGIPEMVGACYANLVSFGDFRAYRSIVKTWQQARGAMYSKSRTIPKDTEGAKALFSLLGLQSWTQIPGAPGYSKFKVDDLRENKGLEFLKLDQVRMPKEKGKKWRTLYRDRKEEQVKKSIKNQTPIANKDSIDFDWLLKAVNQYFYWLCDLNDPLRLRVCSTVHKAQGKTIEDVIIHLPELYDSRTYGRDAQDNAKRAIYTAASRASKRLYIIV